MFHNPITNLKYIALTIMDEIKRFRMSFLDDDARCARGLYNGIAKMQDCLTGLEHALDVPEEWRQKVGRDDLRLLRQIAFLLSPEHSRTLMAIEDRSHFAGWTDDDLAPEPDILMQVMKEECNATDIWHYMGHEIADIFCHPRRPVYEWMENVDDDTSPSLCSRKWQAQCPYNPKTYTESQAEKLMTGIDQALVASIPMLLQVYGSIMAKIGEVLHPIMYDATNCVRIIDDDEAPIGVDSYLVYNPKELHLSLYEEMMEMEELPTTPANDTISRQAVEQPAASAEPVTQPTTEEVTQPVTEKETQPDDSPSPERSRMLEKWHTYITRGDWRLPWTAAEIELRVRDVLGYGTAQLTTEQKAKSDDFWHLIEKSDSREGDNAFALFLGYLYDCRAFDMSVTIESIFKRFKTTAQKSQFYHGRRNSGQNSAIWSRVISLLDNFFYINPPKKQNA